MRDETEALGITAQCSADVKFEPVFQIGGGGVQHTARNNI